MMMMYADTRSRVGVAGVLSEDFPIEVGVHQSSALSPLLFILVVEEATKECGGGSIWELLYADDLVLTAESKEEVELKFVDWKQAMARRGMKVNIGKSKLMVTGMRNEVIISGRYPCGVCGRGVGQTPYCALFSGSGVTSCAQAWPDWDEIPASTFLKF